MGSMVLVSIPNAQYSVINLISLGLDRAVESSDRRTGREIRRPAKPGSEEAEGVVSGAALVV